MKPFKEGEKTIVYDPVMELIRETALLSLNEASGNLGEASRIFNERGKDLVLEKNDRYKEEFGQLQKILTNPRSALLKLREFVGPELEDQLNRFLGEFSEERIRKDNVRFKDLQDGIMEKVRQEIKIPQWLQAISGTPAGICVACTAGYTVDADTGITYNLKAQKDLYNMVEEVWENAMNELHLFQRGPTHQGTKHCIQVLENLNVLLEEIKTQKGFTFNIAVRVGLSIAAALHDIGKGDIVDPEGKSHAKNGAQVIKQRPDIFLLDLGFSDFVSEVVNTHAPEGRHPPIIDNVTAIPIKGHGVNMTCSTDQVKKACSLFQLADTMDTTKDRVSDSVLKVLSQLYSYPCKLHTEFIYKKNVIENRKKIDSVYPEWVPFPCIRVKTTPAVITEVEYQIKRENQDLSDTGAEGVLSALKWFSKLGY